MTKETKALTGDAKSLAAEMMATFEVYKNANDARLLEIEQKGAADTVLRDKLDRLDKRIDTLSLKAARPADSVADPDLETHNSAWSRYLRSGDESGLARLDT